ncbi:MAG: ABC transporter permease, partial [Betaproteobacteria bacterium HGW-Betaproteobacteria-7]
MTLAPVFLGSLARRRVVTLFSALAIVLGVALGMAVQAVHQAALGEFDRGLRTLAGAADLQVVGPRGGFDEQLYAVLAARPEVAAASPLLEIQAKLVGREDSLQLFGIDVFTLAAVSPALLPGLAEGAGRFAALAGDGLFLATAAQEVLGVQVGDTLTLQAGSGTLDLPIVGDLPGARDERRLAVLDIAAVQQRFGRLGRLTRIDLRLAEGMAPDAARAALQPLLPPGVVLETPQAAADEVANLSRAYRVNLTLLAAMALLTGGFLVFSAQALSVLRRRGEFAFLRAIGLSRASLFRWLLAEGALIGLLGGVLGAALGLALAAAVLALLGGDLGAGYFSGLQPRLQIQPAAIAIYVALGVIAGIAGAWLPAREAAAVAPAQALKAGDEAALTGPGSHPWLAAGLLLATGLASQLPPQFGLPLGGYLAIALLLAGSVLLLPSVAALFGRRLQGLRAVPG